MTEIGVMSMQRIFNYGSSLQAYALRNLLIDASPGSEVRYLDYRAGAPLMAEGTATRSKLIRTLTKVREYGETKAAISDKTRFFNHKRHYARRYYSQVGIEQSPQYGTAVDLQVIGSDEVFNCVQANANVGFSRDLFGIESAAKSVVSYAASFGNTTLAKLDAYGVRDIVADGLRNFDAVSVRDENSARIVEELCGERPEIHLDPTLVYNLMGRDEGVPRGKIREKPYMIVYGYSGRFTAAENVAVKEFARAHGLRVLAFGGLQECADEFVDCGPFELLAYFRDAAYVVTDTFHGTIFSVINEVPFASIIRRSRDGGYGNEEKLGYLLNRLALSGRAYESGQDLVSLLTAPIEYEPVRAIRVEEASRARAYLHRVCSEISPEDQPCA